MARSLRLATPLRILYILRILNFRILILLRILIMLNIPSQTFPPRPLSNCVAPTRFAYRHTLTGRSWNYGTNSAINASWLKM